MENKVPKIPSIEEMKKRALELGKNMPNIEGKVQFVNIRGYIIEFAISSRTAASGYSNFSTRLVPTISAVFLMFFKTKR